jgi:nicotinate-nucleotide pyrophosphorylase (carboxylating)
MDYGSRDAVKQLVQAALEEDIGSGDATTLATIPEHATATALVVAREPLIVCGLFLAEATFAEMSSAIGITRILQDGARAERGSVLLRLEGPARPILTGERVALNFVQRLSGVASLTAQFVAAITGASAKILDTRKTTPGWRALQKYAVRCGGGENHRQGLYDMVLIKDNHLAGLQQDENPIAAAVTRARQKYPKLKVEVEADTLDQVAQALAAGADIILLDNMPLDRLREAVKLAKGRAKTEASGGVTLATVRDIAATGVDYISVGALTHSARAMDIALDFELSAKA